MKKPLTPKKYLKLYQENAKGRVLQILFTFPEKEFSLSDLAREAGIAKANIGTVLKEFQETGLIQIEKLSKIWRIRAQQTSWVFVKHKIAYNLDFIYKSGLVEFLIDYFKNPRSIILFGSFRKGEDISNSDIDIAVESSDFTTIQSFGLRELSEFEQEIKRKIQLHVFNQKNIDPSLFSNIANGIVLWGFLEIHK